MSDYEIRRIDASTVLQLRRALLRRYRTDSPSVMGDEHPSACHIGAYRDDRLVAVGSIHPEAMPGGYRTNAWRFHGVAVDHGHRGVGVGALITERCLEHAAGREAKVVWCVAPAGAYGFFERYGFRRTGDPIDDADGPQYMLFAELGPLRRSWALEEE